MISVGDPPTPATCQELDRPDTSPSPRAARRRPRRSTPPRRQAALANGERARPCTAPRAGPSSSSPSSALRELDPRPRRDLDRCARRPELGEERRTAVAVVGPSRRSGPGPRLSPPQPRDGCPGSFAPGAGASASCGFAQSADPSVSYRGARGERVHEHEGALLSRRDS